MNPSSTIMLIATSLLASVHLGALDQSQGNECSKHTECHDDLACVNHRCVHPCSLDPCGSNALCRVLNHSPICQCLPNFTGNPFDTCHQVKIAGEYKANSSRKNTKCKVFDGVQTCACIRGYYGDPLIGCRAECESNHECGNPGCCRDFLCYPDDSCESYVPIYRIDRVKTDPNHPCDPDPCGFNEICREKNGNAFCQCRYAPFLRLPESGCNSECSRKFNCPSDKTCIQSECVNACPGDCSQNDECYVFNNKAKCRPKNSRPECTSNNDCPSDKACDGYKCVDPCEDHCVKNADCRIVDQQPICTCQPGYFEGPYGYCHLEGTIVE